MARRRAVSARSRGRRRGGGGGAGQGQPRRRVRRRTGRSATGAARASLRNFRQAGILAVAITAFLLLFLPGGSGSDAQTVDSAQAADTAQAAGDLPDTVSVIEDIPVEDLQVESGAEPEPEEVRADTLFQAAQEEALRTARSLWYGFLSNLPKFAVAIGVLVLAWLAVRLIRPLLRRVFRQWERANATVALVGIAIWLFALGVAVSVLAGDIRALVGSLGLVGLALSWALQTPIESFTGWLLNSFQGYFRVGDRIAVGEVFGDVYQIDFLTTTVWESGSLERPGFVQAEQPTGRLITFPNSEVLAGSIVNLTRDFPYVWDELTVGIGGRSDLEYASDLLYRVTSEHLKGHMEAPAAAYEAILRRAGLETSVAPDPQVFVSTQESWTNLTARYLVGARERRIWKSRLTAAVIAEFNDPAHSERIISAFPRTQVQFIGPDGQPREPGGWTEQRKGSE